MNATSVPQMPLQPPRPWSLYALCAGLLCLLVASFITLKLQWSAFLEPSALRVLGEFVTGFWPPETSPKFLGKLVTALAETLAMSVLGTLGAALAGLALAYTARSPSKLLSSSARGAMNILRSIPELVWASLLIVAAGLGPFAGTLALTIHTAGVLGRLFTDALENAPQHAQRALVINGASRLQALLYATLPQALPQLIAYTLYRWENNIRAAAVLGVVGAGGLGQMLKFHLSLFQMQPAASVIMAMLALVLAVDGFSFWVRRRLT